MYLTRNTDYEVEYDSKSFSFWQKIVWTYRIWVGHKIKIKQKVRVIE